MDKYYMNKNEVQAFEHRYPQILEWTNFIIPRLYDESLSLSQAVFALRGVIVEIGMQLKDISCEFEQFKVDMQRYVETILKEQLQEWLEDGTLQGIIDGILGELDMSSEYVSEVSDEIFTYGYTQYMKEVDRFKCKYKKIITVSSIGKSYLGRDIPVIAIGDVNSKTKALVIGQHHAREFSTTQLIMKQIERYCENWNNTYIDEKVKDIFNGNVIYFIPMTNPDGAELVIQGLSSIPVGTPNYNNLINNVKSALEYKIRNNLDKGDIPHNWDLMDQVVWNGNKGKIENYGFREKDLMMWKSNLEGIDLHYNCWEEDINRSAENSYLSSGAHTQGEFRSENEIGLIGWGAFENISLKKFIEANNLYQYTISYHNKSPIIQWNLDLTGKHFNRVLQCATELAELTRTRFATGRGTQVGFSGYMIAYGQKNMGDDNFSEDAQSMFINFVFETGWQRKLPFNPNNHENTWSNEIQPAPLPNEQAPYIFDDFKDATLYWFKKYVRYQDKYNKYPNVNVLAMQPKNLTALYHPINSDNTLDKEQFGGAYNIRYAVMQTIGNRVFLDVDLSLSAIGKLDLESTKAIALRAIGLPAASSKFAPQYLSSSIRVANYKNPIGDKSAMLLYAYINKGEDYIRFMCYNPNTNSASPIRLKDIENGFRVVFQISFPIDINVG